MFRPTPSGKIATVYERAHIIAQRPGGPRGVASDQRREELDEYDNLVLLCADCHRMVDDNPSDYPTDLLYAWKRDHSQKLDELFRVPVFSSRGELNALVGELLEENHAIFLEYGPHSGKSIAREADAAAHWHRLVLETIIPNNRRIVRLAGKNRALLSTDERGVVGRFRLHADALEFNHLTGEKNASAPLFPSEMGEIFRSLPDA